MTKEIVHEERGPLTGDIVTPAEPVLDVACGSGPAVELADALGAQCAGSASSSGVGFLAEAPDTDAKRELFAHDVADLGYVMNASHLWANMPAAHDDLFDLINSAAKAANLTFRQRGILVSACASSLGDSYCSLAWGSRLASVAGDEVAGTVLCGGDDINDPAELALARWARQITTDPNGTQDAHVEPLRRAGYRDDQIFAITLYVSLRIAFSTVNDALGAQPDHQLAGAAPHAVRSAVTWGRPASTLEAGVH